VVFSNIDFVSRENFSQADGSVVRFFFVSPEVGHSEGSLNPLGDFDELAAGFEATVLANGFQLNPDLVSPQA